MYIIFREIVLQITAWEMFYVYKKTYYKKTYYKKTYYSMYVIKVFMFIKISLFKYFYSIKIKLFKYFYSLKINLFKYFYNNEMPKPHSFATKPLRSDMSEIITQINSLLPQLDGFINQFNTTVSQSGINVVTDSVGNMNIDVPQNMPDSVAKNISTRIGIIDRLITTRGQEINDLIQKGIDIENNLKMENPNYKSQLNDKVAEFKRLNSLYKH